MFEDFFGEFIFLVEIESLKSDEYPNGTVHSSEILLIFIIVIIIIMHFTGFKSNVI